MLNKEMTLKNMIDMVPGGDDMAMLDLDVVVYIKATIVSIDKQINHAFIRHMLIERYQRGPRHHDYNFQVYHLEVTLSLHRSF